MKTAASLTALLLILTHQTVTAGAYEDWPSWRGPSRNNVAPGNQSPPTSWSENENIVWKSEVPGRGHASPVMVGNRIFLATAEDEKQIQSVVCFRKDNGKKLWQTTVNEGNFPAQIHRNNTHASQTIACSGDRIFVTFHNNGGVQLTSLDFDGNLKWQKFTGNFKTPFPFGYGSSPCLFGNTVIVLSDMVDEGYLAAYDQKTGDEVWRTKRGQTASFATPIVGKINGEDQIIVSGTDVRGYNPETGKELWYVDCPWKTTCGTLVWDGDTIFVGGGFPARISLAVSASKKRILWQVPVAVYEQSLIFKDGFVYAHADSGAAYCWRGSRR